MVHPTHRRAAAPSLILAACLAAATAGCVAPPTQPSTAQTVTIGVLAATTGADATAGVDAVRGAQIAVQVVNQSHPEVPVPLASGAGLPGLAGATVKLVTADTKGSPAEVTERANSLIADGATALVVSDTAEVAVAAGSQTQRSQVPLVDARSTADFVTEQGMDWYFRTVPTDRDLAEVVFALLRRQLTGTATKIALLTESGGRNAAAAAGVRELAVRAGYQIPIDQEISGELSDLDTRAKQVADIGCDVILALADTSAGATEASQLASRLPTRRPLIGLGSGFAAVGASGSGLVVLRAATWSAELARRSPVGRAVADLYARQFGGPMTSEAANSFTATIILAMAIDAAGSADRAAVRGALRQMSLPATQMIMPWNGVRFDSEGQNQLAAGVVEGWDKGFRVVYPRELAAGPMIWTAQSGAPP